MKKIFLLFIILFAILLTACNEKNNQGKENTQVVQSESSRDESETKPYEGYYTYSALDGRLTAENIENWRIADKTLEVMSSEQLAQAVADYPGLVGSVLLSSSYEINTVKFAEKCDAYYELIKNRSDAKNVLMDKIMELDKNSENETVVSALKRIMLSEMIFKNKFTKEELDYLSE